MLIVVYDDVSVPVHGKVDVSTEPGQLSPSGTENTNPSNVLCTTPSGSVKLAYLQGTNTLSVNEEYSQWIVVPS